MKKLLPIFVGIILGSQAFAGRLVVLGGRYYNEAAMSRFTEWAGGETAHILVISWASEQPETEFGGFLRNVEDFKPAEVIAAVPRHILKQNCALIRKQIHRATGIYFTGGDQITLMKAVHICGLAPLFKKRFDQKIPFGGMSAGMAIMSDVMLTRDERERQVDPENVELARGLGLVEKIILDQHFLERDRIARLASALLASRQIIGIGVDENAAAAITDETEFEVLGYSQVTLIEKQTDGFRMRFLSPGTRVRLKP